MNTDDLIKTAKYLDELGSYKTADQFENKLVKLAQGGKLIVDPKIRKEYDFIKKLLENIKEGKTSSYGYNTINFYPSGDCPYISGHTTVKPTVEALNKRLKFITSTEFIKGFNLLRADHLENTVAPNAYAEIQRQKALNKAKELKNNANSGATSPFLPESVSSKPGTSSSGKPSSGTSRKPGSSGATVPGKASVKVKPTGAKPSSSGASSSGGGKPGIGISDSGSSVSATPAAPGGAPSGTVPAAKLGTVAELDTLIADLENITANQKIWSENSNSIIPKIRNANRLFTSLYETLNPRQARFFGNRLDMISIANTTYVGKTGTGMR
jgi:hypothetical protein